MVKCTFCGSESVKRMYVLNSGVVRYFCSAKCEKNSELGRNPRKITWVRKSALMKAQQSPKSKVPIVK